MTNPLFRGFRRLALLSLSKPLFSSSTFSRHLSLSNLVRPILGNPEKFLNLSRLVLKERLIQQNPCWESRTFSHGRLDFVVTRDGKLKFEEHEVEAPKTEKWKTKKKLKLQRKREKKKRKAANKRDPRRLGVQGKKKKQKFDTAEERIKQKIENAKVKEAMLIERLKRYEVTKVQGPEVKPHFLTGEERFYIKKMAQKKSNYVPIGKRGVFGGVILNMHLHWKRHETVKVICKPCKPGQIQEYVDEIARLSGGIPIQIIANDTIVFYRGREYVQPEIMYPIDTLSKKRALEKSKYEQSLESVRHFIAIAEKELALYYRHVALYDEPNNRSAYSILDENSALVHYIQVHQDDFMLNVKLQLFALIAKQPAFHQLRSVEQLGYITVLMQRSDSGVHGVQFIVQSTAKDPKYIDTRVELFMKMFESKLYEMTSDEFKNNVNALIDMKLEKHKNLREESRFYWREISDGTLKFDRRDREIDALKQLTQKELTDFFDEYIKVSVPRKKALSVRVYGSSHSSQFQAHKNEQMEPNAVQIEEIFSFRRSRPLYSSFKGGFGHVRL